MPVVIIVPAEEAQPCHATRLPADSTYLARLEELVDGPLVTATYDRDAHLWVNDLGAGVLPVNHRATRYVQQQSEAARRHPIPADYRLWGDVVIAGSSPAGDVDVPSRFYDLFGTAPPPPDQPTEPAG